MIAMNLTDPLPSLTVRISRELPTLPTAKRQDVFNFGKQGRFIFLFFFLFYDRGLLNEILKSQLRDSTPHTIIPPKELLPSRGKSPLLDYENHPKSNKMHKLVDVK